MVYKIQTELTKFWANFDFGKPPYIHPSDQATRMLAEEDFLSGIIDLDTFVDSADYGKKKSTLLHDHLLPSPFAGDLRRGDIFLLLLNPGFNIGDYFGERQPTFRRALRATLDQKLEEEEFPFMWLNPELSFHPGFVWWHKKLGGLIQMLADQWNSSHYEASRRLSRRLVGLELFPYHSQSFDNKHLNKKLRSMEVMLNYVSGLSKRALSGEVFITVMRKPKEWNLQQCDCVHVFSPGAARGAHLTPHSDAGQKIIDFIYRIPRE
jgi:hypothetical protein